MKRKQNDADFLKFLQNMPIPKVKNPEYKKSLESMFVRKKAKHIRIRGEFRNRLLRFSIPLAAALLMVAVLFFVVIPGFNPPAEITLVGLNGRVSIIDRKSGTETKAVEGMKVKAGKMIRTVDEGGAELLFGLSTSVTLGKQSSMELVTLQNNAQHENYLVRLQQGTIVCKVNLKNRKSSFQVATEYSLITVHGTHFSITLTPEDLVIVLEEGSIALDNYYSLRPSLEALRLKSAALYTRVSEILNTYVQQFDKATIIKTDITEIKGLNQALQNEIQRIIRTESSEEIDKKIEEIRQTLKTSSASHTQGKDSSTVKNMLHEEPSPTETQSPQKAGKNTSAAVSVPLQKKPETIVTINLNGSVENGTFAPDYWQTSEQSPVFKWADSVSRTGRRSLQISSTHGENRAIGWAYTLDKDLPYNKRVFMKVYIKTEAISGQGVNLVLRADDTVQPAGNAEIYATSQGRRNITGTTDWKEYTLALPEPIYENIKSITLYLIMPPETKGTVYFDDISLYFKE